MKKLALLLACGVGMTFGGWAQSSSSGAGAQQPSNSTGNQDQTGSTNGQTNSPESPKATARAETKAIREAPIDLTTEGVPARARRGQTAHNRARGAAVPERVQLQAPQQALLLVRFETVQGTDEHTRPAATSETGTAILAAGRRNGPRPSG